MEALSYCCQRTPSVLFPPTASTFFTSNEQPISINRSTKHQATHPSHHQQCPASSHSPAVHSAQPPVTPPPSSSPSPPNPSAAQLQDKPAARPKARTPTQPTPLAKRISWTCSPPTAKRRKSKLSPNLGVGIVCWDIVLICIQGAGRRM
jgi:hypothetical protein